MFEQGVRILDELGRKVFWRPSREINVHLWFMQAHRKSLILPGKGGVSHNDGHIREIDCYVIQIHRIGIFETYPSTTAHTRSHPTMPGMEESGQTGFGDNL